MQISSISSNFGWSELAKKLYHITISFKYSWWNW